MRLLKLLVLAFCLLLNACVLGTSQNAKFYTLSSMPVTVQSNSYAAFVGINRVQLPRYMDRPQMTTQGQDSVEVNVSEYNRWVEYPNVLATRVLTENLSAALPSAQIKVNPFGTEKFDFVVSTEVIKMDAALGGNVQLDAWYSIKNGSGKLLDRRKFQKSIDIKNSYDDMAKGYSRLLALLAQDIAMALVKAK